MYRLAFIDDETATRDTLCSCFPWEKAGFEIVAQLGNGMEALKYLLQHELDAILCDIKMPVMNGIELAREIHERKLPVQVILLSGLRDFELARQAISYGVRHYMVKPAKFQNLHDVLMQLKQELDEQKGRADESDSDVPMQADVSAQSPDHPVIQRILHYIEAEYRNVTLEDVARFVHMNPSYVSSYFRKLAGQKFSDYVLAVRMRKAAELLREHRWKALEVSEMVGYANAKNFIRAFKQYYGKTPGQFKHEH
ncbi:response regulator [Bacillus sp. 3255]|uniref:response regulator transcription factor n=1 Tax=Bacillus sp. 3255 TaxID=2817904 RepID=UPI0028580ECE|nr:response regulator [Bacillus sp. 3255]MDR6878814.1 YesN/AraC family two-component response regulator [Bacillus sp. 3255]